jgi:hypothetical protein
MAAMVASTDSGSNSWASQLSSSATIDDTRMSDDLQVHGDLLFDPVTDRHMLPGVRLGRKRPRGSAQRW